MSASNARELVILDAEFGSGAPATWYIGLSTTTPDDAGASFTEPAGGAYARAAVTNNATNFPAATTVSGVGTKKNGTAVTFPTATANWGTITHLGLFTASSGGTPAYTQALDASTPVNNGDTASFAANAISLTAD